MIEVILFACMTYIGALWGRIDGGGVFKVSNAVERFMCILFFVVACIPFAGVWSVFAFLGIAGLATGHGQYFFARAVKYIKPEKLDFIVKLVFGDDPRSAQRFKAFEEYNADEFRIEEPETFDDMRHQIEAYGVTKLYKRCAFGMFVTGSLVGLPSAVLAIIYGEWLSAALLSSTGLIKAVSYMAGYAAFKNTESAEWMNGGLRSAVCAIVLLIVGVS